MAQEILQEIADIAISRPDLTPDEWLVVEKASAYYKALLKPEVRQELEALYAAKYAEYQEASQLQIKEMIQAKFDEWKKIQEPLGTDELKKLLSQKYEEVKIELYDYKEETTKYFTIRELPKSVELKFYDLAKKQLIPFLETKALSDFKFKFDSTLAEKIIAILDMVPDTMSLFSQICAICLDPFEKEHITEQWVSDNLSIERIQAILLLQFEANRYRDFFSHAYRWFQNLRAAKTMAM